MSKSVRFLALCLASTMGLGCADTDVDSIDDAELNQDRQQFVDAINGLKTVNGLTTRNGLKTINGLTTTNGLKTVNGLTTVNGLKTINGLKTMNGLSVDCTDKTAAQCTGLPDGILSNKTGMMASDNGIMTAKYLVRCALPASTAVTVKDYTGALVTLNGEVGLAPEWAEGQCEKDCQEEVSACLMALTNGKGEHVDVELSSQDSVIGTGNSYAYQEAVFYGNLFLDTPVSNFCVGKDYAGLTSPLGTINLGAVAVRTCEGFMAILGEKGCPYIDSGSCNAQLFDLFGTNSKKCEFSNGAASKCSVSGSSSKVWTNPITTYRKTK